jgi:hypothetical protein
MFIQIQNFFDYCNIILYFEVRLFNACRLLFCLFDFSQDGFHCSGFSVLPQKYFGILIGLGFTESHLGQHKHFNNIDSSNP